MKTDSILMKTLKINKHDHLIKHWIITEIRLIKRWECQMIDELSTITMVTMEFYYTIMAMKNTLQVLNQYVGTFYRVEKNIGCRTKGWPDLFLKRLYYIFQVILRKSFSSQCNPYTISFRIICFSCT